jgi:signal transduction histidine kinase/putative methionine-R-sulfoxide reductase with GAF domain
LEDTLEAILQMALDITGARYGIFRLLDKSGQNLITRSYAGENLDRPKVEAISLESNSIMAFVARNRQLICIEDLHAAQWQDLYYPLDAGLEMRSELAVPLVSGSGRLEGVLNLESPEIGAFGEQDSHLLQSLATQAVIAIQEVRLVDALQEAARLLLTVSRSQIMKRLAELACDLLNVDSSAVWTLEDGRLQLEASSGAGPIFEEESQPEGLAQQAIRQRSLAAGRMRFEPPDPASQWVWMEVLVVPLLVNEDSDPVGVFNIYSRALEVGRFAQSDWEKKVLACLAQYAALAVRNESHQEALRNAQEQRAVAETFAVVGDVAANLLHQLNNKVGTIPVRVQGIQDKCQQTLADDHYLAANLAEIERSASEAMEAVRENLAHLRPIHLAEVAVKSCVEDALEVAELPGGIKVRLEGLDHLPMVFAGQRSLALVFTNLLENAAEAMRGEGAITIRGAARKKWVEVLVVDDGPGIPVEVQDRIFELDYSGRAATRKGKLGFGLWWVKTLMARLGGSVSIESDGTRGSTFRLRLPAVGGRL